MLPDSQGVLRDHGMSRFLHGVVAGQTRQVEHTRKKVSMRRPLANSR